MSKLLPVVVLGICLVLGIVPAQAQQWVEYRPAGMGFRVELPGSPEIADNTAKGGANVSAMIIASVAPSDDFAYIAMYSTFKPGTLNSDPQVSLDGAMRGMATQGKVRSQKPLSFGTAPARYVIVDTAANQAVVDLITLSGDTLIQIICVVPKGQEETSPIIDHIVKSFALVAR